MTNKTAEDEAREWANHRCPEQGPEFIVWCMCKEDYLEGHKRGYARALEEVERELMCYTKPVPEGEPRKISILVESLQDLMKIFKSKGGA